MMTGNPDSELELPKTDGVWTDCVLGVTAQELQIEQREELRMIAQHMADQAKKSVYILSHDLDSVLYDSEPFVEALSRLARRSKYCFVNVLVFDSNTAVKDGHRLVELYQRLNPYVRIRKISQQYKDYTSAFLLADVQGVIFRQFAGSYSAVVNYQDPLQCSNLLKFFEEVWEMSEEDPQLRRLYI
jgi:hypothetical protein